MLASLERYQITLVHRTEESEPVNMAYVKGPTSQMCINSGYRWGGLWGKLGETNLSSAFPALLTQWKRTWALESDLDFHSSSTSN